MKDYITKLLPLVQNICIECRQRITKKNVIYYIEVNSNVSGFFALLRGALDLCCYADENGFFPYIKYGKETLYSEKALFLGTSNPFEYYYIQPISICQKPDIMWGNIIKSQQIHADLIEYKYNFKPFSYLVESSYIEQMAVVYKKYMRLNEKTKTIVEQRIRKKLKEKKTLGVHIRGTDFYKEFNNHPVPVTVDEYAEVINREVEHHHFMQVFIATDDVRCLKELEKKVSVPLVYYKNTMRASSNKSVAFEKNNRKYNNYLLGLEVLTDAYTLSSCQGLIGCLSQVDIFVQIIKKSRGERFDPLCIISKGIVNNNRQ